MISNIISKKKRTKGQAITADFLLGIIILMIVISVAGSSWNRSIYLIREKNERTHMRRLGMSVSSMLVKSSGVPSDWDANNVVTIGLVDKPNILDYEKIVSFNSMEQSKIHDLLGINGFGFSFRIRAVNDTILFDYGASAPADKDVIVIRRLALYDSTAAFVEFGLWRE